MHTLLYKRKKNKEKQQEQPKEHKQEKDNQKKKTPFQIDPLPWTLNFLSDRLAGRVEEVDGRHVLLLREEEGLVIALRCWLLSLMCMCLVLIVYGMF